MSVTLCVCLQDLSLGEDFSLNRYSLSSLSLLLWEVHDWSNLCTCQLLVAARVPWGWCNLLPCVHLCLQTFFRATYLYIDRTISLALCYAGLQNLSKENLYFVVEVPS